MRPCIPLAILALSFVHTSLSRPLRQQCFGCPAENEDAEDNYIQEMHQGALVCFYGGSSAACIYDPVTGEAWPNPPDACPLTAELGYCASNRESKGAKGGVAQVAVPGSAPGSIMAVMKEKTGGRLSSQERLGQGRILADRLAKGGRF